MAEESKTAPKRVFLHKNVAGAEPQTFAVGNMTFKKFKKAAGKKLKIKAARVFLESGVEITAVDELQDGDMLYISEGKNFYGSAGSAEGVKTLHIAVLGVGHVGKSALTLRFVRDFFIKDWDPTIEDAYRKSFNVDDRPVQLEILDTAGQDDFECLRPQWMMDKDGYLFVYSLDDESSLEQLQQFMDLHTQINDGRRVPIVLAANKCDLVKADPTARRVSEAAGKAKAAEFGAEYIETSAFSGHNVYAAFETIVRAVWGSEPKPEKKKSGWSFPCAIL